MPFNRPCYGGNEKEPQTNKHMHGNCFGSCTVSTPYFSIFIELLSADVQKSRSNILFFGHPIGAELGKSCYVFECGTNSLRIITGD
eukprot:6191953-Pleurochrysis_carterae.AAC.2